MDGQNLFTTNVMLNKVKNIIMNTDIRILVVFPPILGFGGFFVWLFIMDQLTQHTISRFFFDIGLGIACLIEFFSGVAEVYKKEMPGEFGKIIAGKIAIGSGIIILVIFGSTAVVSFISGVASLLGK